MIVSTNQLARWYGPRRLHFSSKHAQKSVLVHAQLSSTSIPRRLINVKAEDRLIVSVIQQHDPGAGLEQYMRLPVSQFVLVKVPLGSTLRRIGSELFEIVVPKLELFGIWIQPRVKCTVRSESENVDIQSVSLNIEGSDLVQKLRLNDRVEFDVHCRFTHTTGSCPEIHCHSLIHATVDPPALFGFIPDNVLSNTASAVIKASLSALQRTFVPSLAEDYAKWATSEIYRQQRIQHAIESDAALKSEALLL